MKKILISAILLAMVIGSCDGQKKENLIACNANDTINHPQTNIKVNREYDKNGNLIRYDSTYSYSYSNVSGSPANIDSLLNQFGFQMGDSGFFFQNPFDQDFFSTDSLFWQDPFMNPGYFGNSIQEQMEMMEQMIRRMDSISQPGTKPQFNSQRKNL
jgi:hypothetical protein